MRLAVRILVLSLALLAAAPGVAPAHDSALHAPAPAGGQPAPAHEDTIQELDVDFSGIVERSASAMATTAAAALPVTWCGDERTTDDTVDAVHAGSLPQFKLVYAYPSDRPNRFGQWKDLLQANVSLIGQFVAQQSAGRKAPRWDMGTRCGPDYADITVVRLPRTRAVYAENFGEVANDVSAALGTSGMRTPVVLADHLSNRGQYSLFGQGTIATGPEGWRPDAANANNLEPGFTTIWVSGAFTPPANPADGYWPEGFLHEMSHNMGAVQWSAPHTTSSHPRSSAYSHCWDGYDVMCYADGPAMGHAYETSHCARSVGAAIPSLWDCGRDDYFDPAPPAGSYLDTHWNVHDSVYLGECPSLGSACATATGPPVSGTPAVSGRARQGETLSMTPGTWPADAELSVRWQREGEFGNWVDIPGATASRHVLAGADAGVPLRVRVTAAGESGTSVVHSLPTEPVEPASGVPVNTSRPQISGRLRHGQTLHVYPGSWSSADRTTPRWERLDEATGEWQIVSDDPAYTVRAADVDRFLRITVTAANGVGSATASSPSRFVALPPDPGPVGVSPPSIAGRLTAGSTLTGDDGGWTGADRVTVEWQRYQSGAWVGIGVSGPSFTTSAADAGARLRLSVVASSAAGTVRAQSVAVRVASPAPPASVAAPVVRGRTDAVGHVLETTTGAWTDAERTEIQWQRLVGGAWTAVPGATGATYTTAGGDRGVLLRARVTASNPDGSRSADSAPVGPIVAAPPENLALPAITGTPREGRVLTATPGGWTGAPAYAYRWERQSPSGWVAIDRAAAPTHLLTADDVGQPLRVVVTATNADGVKTAASAATAAVAGAPAPLPPPAPAPDGTGGPGAPSPAPPNAPPPDGTGGGPGAPAPAPLRPPAPGPDRPGAPAPPPSPPPSPDGAGGPGGGGPGPAPHPAAPPGMRPLPVAPSRPRPVAVRPPGTASPTPWRPSGTAASPAAGRAPLPLTLRLPGSRAPAVRFALREAGSRLVMTLRGASTTLRDGRYRVRACSGRTCTTTSLRVRKHRATLPPTTLRSAARNVTVEIVGRGFRARARATRG